MKYLIIGSVATYHWFQDARKPADIDILTPAQVVVTGNNSKFCVVDAQWHDAAELLISKNKDPVFLDPDLLFTLKVSHAHWDVKWQKTLFDIEFLKRKDCVLDLEVYHALFKVWSEIHGKKHVNLNQTVDSFFNDAVQRKYNHEALHELVAFNQRPMHELIRPDVNRAWCSEEQFNSLSENSKEELALEEMMVTAIERCKLCVIMKTSEKRSAMNFAHKQLVTSMTTGWFARFLILNRNKLLHERKDKWLIKMNTALQNLKS